MGVNAPKITPAVLQWMERCKNETDPHFTDIHKVVLKVKEKVAQASSKLWFWIEIGFIFLVETFFLKKFRDSVRKNLWQSVIIIYFAFWYWFLNTFVNNFIQSETIKIFLIIRFGNLENNPYILDRIFDFLFIFHTQKFHCSYPWNHFL